MFTFNRVSIFLLSVLFANAQLTAKPINEVNQGLIEVGRGEMSWWWFTLYRAKLLTPSGHYQDNSFPLTLEIEYYRDIESSHLVEATVEQWRHLEIKQEALENWQRQLESLWPNVTKGDRLSFHINQAQLGLFWFNGQPLTKQFTAEFSQSFVDIWLAQETSRPQLRAQLLGEQACDC